MPMPAVSIRQLEAALINADKAGDTAAAQAIATELLRLTTPAPAPVEQTPEAPAKAGFSLPDLGVAFGQGVVGVGKTVTDVFGADNAASQALGRAQESLQGMYTPERQRELAQHQQAMQQAEKEGPLAEAKVALQGVKEAPLQSAAQALGSIIPNLASLLIPGVGEARAGLAARSAFNAALGIIEGVGAVKGSIYDNVKAELERTGVPPEKAAEAATKAQEYLGENMAQIGLGGGFGYVAGKTGLESLLAPTSGKIARKSTALLSEMLTEGGQGAQERTASNIALQKQGFDVPTFQGVVGAGTQEGVMGALGAGAVAPFTGNAAPIPRPVPQPVQQAAPPAVAAPAEAILEPTVKAEAPVSAPEAAQPEAAVAEPTKAAKPPKVEALPAEAKIEGSTLSLMDRHKALNVELDQLQNTLREARAAGDTATIKAIGPEFAAKAKELEQLRTAIDAQGGTTTMGSLAPQETAEIANIDKKIKAIQKRLDNAIENGDGAAMTKLATRLEEVQAQREALLNMQDKRAELQRARDTEKGQTIPLFNAPVQPKEVVRDIEAGAGPLPPEKEKRFRNTMQPDLFGDRNKEEIERQRRMRRAKPEVGETGDLFPKAELAIPKRPQKPVQMVNAMTGRKMGKVTPEAFAGPARPEAAGQEGLTLDLFSEFNALNTAMNNNEIRTLDEIHKAQDKAARYNDRKGTGYKPVPREQIAAKFAPVTKGIKRYEKVQDTYEYEKDDVVHTAYESDRINAEIAAQRRKLEEGHTDKNGVTKRSMLQKLYDAEEGVAKAKEKLDELKAADAPAARIAGAEKKLQAAQKALTDQNARVKPEMEKLQALTRSLHKVSEVKTDAEKQAEITAFGKSKRESSKEARQAKKVEQGELPINKERVAIELGLEDPDVQKYAEAEERELLVEMDKYNAFTAQAKKAINAAKKKYGENSDKAKKVESNAVAKAKELLDIVDKKQQEAVARINEKAAAVGMASPEFDDAVADALLAYVESAATAGPQEVKSKRTPQATRKTVAPHFKSGTEEGKATAAKRQADFERRSFGKSIAEEEEDEEKSTREAARKEELLAMAKRSKKKPAPNTAMGKAMREAAEAVASEKEEPRQAKGVEEESPDLTATQIQHIENNDIQSALRDIANDKTTSDTNRAVATALATLLDNTSIQIESGLKDADGNTVLGEAVSTMVKLNREGGLSQEVLLHEATHAGVERVIQIAERNPADLTPTQRTAYEELKALWEAAKDDPSITSANAKGSLSEFAAEVMSNSKLQGQLRAMPWKLSDAWNNFKSIVLRLLGVKNVDNMLDAAMQSVDALFIPSSAQPNIAEKPSYAKSEVGVIEKAKNVFSFRPATQVSRIAPSFVGQADTKASLIGNVTGLEGRVQFVDKDAAISEALRKGVDAEVLSNLDAQNAEYALRFGANRSQYAVQFLTNGPVQLVENKTDAGIERIYKSKEGATLTQVADAIAPSKIGNDTEKEAILTALIAGERAKKLGWDTLNVKNPAAAEAEYDSVVKMLDASPADKEMFTNAMNIYREYNAGLLDFLVQTGALSTDKAKELKAVPFVPFYRVENDQVELVVSGETPVRIGNVRDQPELKALVGDSRQIQPIFTSAVQNTFMITNMGLRNQSVKETAFALHKVGIASVIGEGMGPAGPDTVRFFRKGEQYHVVIDTDLYGIPADLVVKGMEGIKTSIPAVVKLMGMPANILRQFVTRNPAYAIKQAVRDPMTAWLTTGTDGVPVINSFKELATMVAGRSEAERELMAAGAISSNVLTGDEQDMAAALRKLTSGKRGWANLMARLDAFAMQGDAATRAVVYRDSLNKGMTEQQALLRTLESMNFGRRGLSPSMQVLSTIIPFFNAQIQGIDVLYRAFKGEMPYNDQLQIRRKLMARGLLLAMGTLAYAAMMGDNDDYKRARPEERMANWFVPNPFGDEMLRIPVPFELGYLFKSLPEAVWNMASDDTRSKDITQGMGKVLWMSNPFSLPQAIKPATEAYLGKSFFGSDIESMREQKTMLPTERYRDSSTELAKSLGSITGDAGLTPIKIDYLIRGYTGPLGVALVSMVNPILRSGEEKERPTTKASQMPFVGTLFQPSEGRANLDAAYATMLEVQQARGTYKEMLAAGNTEGANKLLDKLQGDMALGSMSGTVQQKLGELATVRRRVLASPMSQAQKDEVLKRIDAARENIAKAFISASERTRHQYNR